MTDTEQHDKLSGADLARTALRAARRTARNAGNAPAKHKRPLAVADRRGRDAREPARLNLVVPALAASQGWALGIAGGSIQDRWAAIVGPDAATTPPSPSPAATPSRCAPPARRSRPPPAVLRDQDRAPGRRGGSSPWSSAPFRRRGGRRDGPRARQPRLIE
ncbi:hypothetical protein [Kitasatospora aureofaciens]|uniref:hypothetical protein n=1 Tax=Kitasatospora aureofaciens TaxID=1894 RepID=UPI003803D92F